MTKNLAGTCKCFTLGLKEIRQLIIYQNSWLLISFQDILVYFISVSISNVLSLSLRTCWWTTRSKSLRPTSTRPSARHRSCRNNWHTRREGAFRGRKDRRKQKWYEPWTVDPSFLFSSKPCRHFTLWQCWVTGKQSTMKQQWERLWTAPLWITKLVALGM